MSQQGAHSYEDKLLEFAYGELPSTEARSVEAHLKGCARCAGALASIRGVRRTMATLEPEPAPEAGLDSLLAYANQAARRIQAGPAPSNTRWRRWVFSLAGVASLAILGVVATRVAELTKTPAAQIAEALREQRAEQKAPPPPPAAAAVDVPTQAAPQPVAQAYDEGHAGTEGLADKLPRNAMDSMEGGKGTLPSAGAQVERKAGSGIGSGLVANKSAKAYVPPVGSGALDRRDYTQRIAKPNEPSAKKRAPAKSDLDSSGWGDARLQNRAGGGSPGGDTLNGYLNQRDAKQQVAQTEERKEAELAKEAERAKSEEEPRRLSLRAAPKDDAADEESSADVAANGPATTQAPEEFRREIAQAEPMPPQTSMSISTGTRQRSSTQASAPAAPAAMPPESYPNEPQSQDRSDAPLRSRQEKLRAQIEATREQSKLIDLYSQLCEVEIDLGLYQPASCQHIIQTFPGMNAAKLARNLLDAQRQRVTEQRVLDQEKAAKSKVIRSDDAARDVRQ